MRYVYLACAGMFVAGLAAACGDDTTKSDDDGGTTTNNGSGAGSTTSAGGNTASSGAGAGATTTSAGTGGGAPVTCSAPTVQSGCPVPNGPNIASVIRVAATLGSGMADATGTLRVRLKHMQLGQGPDGEGIPHTEAMAAATTVGANTVAEVHFDMCLGGEMYSEENCDFSLYAFLDLNNNQIVDQGEPAGQVVVDISCHDTEAQCFPIVLDCTAGSSCVQIPPSTGCSCAQPACNSGISTCS